MKKLFSLLVLALILHNANAQNSEQYAPRVVVGDDIELVFFSPTMFRIRKSELTGEKFPSKYDIPFAIGRIENWEMDLLDWDLTGKSIEGQPNTQIYKTSEISIVIDLKTTEWKVLDKSGKQIYPSDGPIYGMFRDGYSLFDNASFFHETNNNSRYSHWFYNPETHLYDVYLKEDLIQDTYFIYGPSYADIYQQFNDLVGPEPLLPRKGYGFFQTQHLACNGTQEKLMKLANDLRERDIPVDNLIIDFEWGDGCVGNEEVTWGLLDWSENYEKPLSPKEMIDSLKALNLDVMLIHHSAPEYKNRTAQGWTETLHSDELWWQKWKEKLDLGIAGTWQDTRQNDVTDARIFKGTQDHVGDDERILFMGCRKMQAVNPWDFRYSVTPVNNIIGARRYPFDWTGDCSFNWNEFRWQIQAITNSHGPLKGVSYISSDGVGETWQIQARWNQFSDFSAISRSHNPKPWAGDIDVANFQNKIKIQGRDTVIVKETVDNLTHATAGGGTGPTAEKSIRKHRKERYKLLPYIYSAAYENYLTGMPITRPMMIAFPEDYLCFSNTWPYQYMFGENILVAPVYGDFKTMEIYLPRGYDWIDYWSKVVYKGGGVITYNTEDVEKLPLFIKGGAIIPHRPEKNWIAPGELDEITFDIYPSGSSSFVLFEDDGQSIAYQKGEFTKTLISVIGGSDKLEVQLGEMKGEFEGKPESRIYKFRVFTDVNQLSVKRGKLTEKPSSRVDGEPLEFVIEKKAKDQTVIELSR